MRGSPKLTLRVRVDAVLLHLVEQRAVANLQQLRGAAAVPSGPPQRGADVALLEGTHGPLQREVLFNLLHSGAGVGCSTGWTPGPDPLREILELDQVLLGEEHPALDGVLQLADVSRPGVGG